MYDYFRKAMAILDGIGLPEEKKYQLKTFAQGIFDRDY
jgi:hypothetical protein